MTLEPSELATLVNECASLVEGARVENVHQSRSDSLSLSLYHQQIGKIALFFCVHPRSCRFHLLARRPPALSTPPPFCQSLRKCLKGKRLQRVRLGADGWTLHLSFVPFIDARDSSTTLGRYELRFRVSSRRPELVLVDGRGECLQTLDASSPASGTVSEEESHAVFLDSLKDLEKLAPSHVEVARKYRMNDDTVRLADLRHPLQVRVKRVLRRRERVLKKLVADLEKAQSGEEARRYGELLKAALGRMRRGMTEIDVEDYFAPDLRVVTVKLKPELSPIENVELYFKRYKKFVRAVPAIEKRRELIVGKAAALEAILQEINAAETEGALRGLEPAVDQLCGPSRAQPSRAQRTSGDRASGERAKTAGVGPRRILSADDVEILVGRNARGNDQLTFRLARGNDLFLHVSGRAGAHVIVRTEKGKSVPPETLVDAAQLALYYSLPSQSRQRAPEGAAAEVDYTPVKYVRKPKGAPPGLVLLAQHKTIRAKLERARLERLQGGGAL